MDEVGWLGIPTRGKGTRALLDEEALETLGLLGI